MICQPVHGDGLNLCLIYLADLHIKANHLLREEMYPNWNPRNTWNIFLFFSLLILITVTHSAPLCSFWKEFLPSLTSPPKCCGSAWRRNDLCHSYLCISELIVEDSTFMAQLVMSPGYIAKPCASPSTVWDPTVGPSGWLKRIHLDFFFLWLHMWGVYKKGHLVLVFGSSSYPYFVLHWAEGNIVYIRFFKSLSTQY